MASTAAFDKNPQSQARGITLDLGFSSFAVPIPDRLRVPGKDTLQFTLVDCPGHASLIRTIIGGAQIIDLMLLVIDATKGIQTQTAECIVIGEVTCDHLVRGPAGGAGVGGALVIPTPARLGHCAEQD